MTWTMYEFLRMKVKKQKQKQNGGTVSPNACLSWPDFFGPTFFHFQMISAVPESYVFLTAVC